MLWIGFIICNHWGLLKIRHTNHPFLKKMFFNYKSFNLWDSWCQYPSFTFSLAKKKITWERKGSPYPHSHLNSVPCAQNSARHSQSGLTLFKSCLPFPPLRSAPYPLTTPPPTVCLAVFSQFLRVLNSVAFWQVTRCLHLKTFPYHIALQI